MTEKTPSIWPAITLLTAVTLCLMVLAAVMTERAPYLTEYWYLRYNRSRDLVVAVVLAQRFFLAVWLAFGANRVLTRLQVAVTVYLAGATGYLLIAFARAKEISIGREDLFDLAFASGGLILLGCVLLLPAQALLGWRLSPGVIVSPRCPQSSRRISMADLFVWLTLFGAVLALVELFPDLPGTKQDLGRLFWQGLIYTGYSLGVLACWRATTLGSRTAVAALLLIVLTTGAHCVVRIAYELMMPYGNLDELLRYELLLVLQRDAAFVCVLSAQLAALWWLGYRWSVQGKASAEAGPGLTAEHAADKEKAVETR